jgi:hypothetical protein
VTSLIRSEVIKLLSTRTFYGLIAGAAAVVSLGTFLTIMSADGRSLHGPLHEQTFYVLASVNAAVFCSCLESSCSRMRSITEPSSPRFS